MQKYFDLLNDNLSQNIIHYIYMTLQYFNTLFKKIDKIRSDYPKILLYNQIFIIICKLHKYIKKHHKVIITYYDNEEKKYK